MTPQTIDIHVNPSDETIRLGPLAVRFLLTGENSTGSVAAFELSVPAAQRLMAPAHSHDHYEETIYGVEGVLTWTVNGRPIDVGLGPNPLHPARRRAPIRQQWIPGRKGALRDYAGCTWPRVFPRSGRGDPRSFGRPAGSLQNGGNHAPARPNSCAPCASGIVSRAGAQVRYGGVHMFQILHRDDLRKGAVATVEFEGKPHGGWSVFFCGQTFAGARSRAAPAPLYRDLRRALRLRGDGR